MAPLKGIFTNMPARNIVKTYVENGYYHVYNRGIEKRTIFEDEMDYKTFLKYLKEALSPPPNPKYLKVPVTLKGGTFKGVPRPVKNFDKKIELVAYCLMPNHFHLLIKQNDKDSIRGFMSSLLTRYSMYFNKKYERVGPLYQDRYKAVLVNEEPYLLHLSRYIHLNPSEYTKDLEGAYSSYSYYLGKMKADWVKSEMILSYFDKSTKDFLKGTNTYKNFVEKFNEDSRETLGGLILE